MASAPNPDADPRPSTSGGDIVDPEPKSTGVVEEVVDVEDSSKSSTEDVIDLDLDDAAQLAAQEAARARLGNKNRSRSAEPFQDKEDPDKGKSSKSLQQIKIEEAVEDAITGRIIFQDGGAEKPPQ